MRLSFVATASAVFLIVAGMAIGAPESGDSGHHPGPVRRPLDSSHDRSRPGPHGRDRFNRFDTFHNIFVSPRRYHAGPYRKPFGWHYRLWGIGDAIPSLFSAQGYWIENYKDFDLARPPFGCVWIRYGNDAILIDKRSGEVLRVVRDAFY